MVVVRMRCCLIQTCDSKVLVDCNPKKPAAETHIFFTRPSGTFVYSYMLLSHSSGCTLGFGDPFKDPPKAHKNRQSPCKRSFKGLGFRGLSPSKFLGGTGDSASST